MTSCTYSILISVGLATLGVIGLNGCGSPRKLESRPETLKFADTGIDGLEEMRRAFHGFVDVMQEVTGLNVDFYPVADRTIAAAALEAGDVDIVLAGPAEYLFIRSRSNVQPLVAIERAEYHSVIVVPKNSPAQTLADLKGKKIAFKEAGSTSGHIIPTRMFLDAGMVEGRDYQGPLVDRLRYEMLYARDVDAMAGGIRDFRRIESERPGAFRILAESPPLPRDIFVAREGLDPELVAELAEKILEHRDRIMEAILGPGARDKYMGATFVAANDSDYDAMRETHQMLNLPLDN